MARSVWSGVISFGLVSVPVGLFTATEEHEPSFHRFAKGSADRIRYKRINERTGDEVDYGETVKGVEVDAGKYVMVTEEELEQVAPGRSRALAISSFADLDDIDPIYFNKTYYLAPTGTDAEKPYALLRDAMADANRAGIASFVMHGKQHLAAIRPSGQTLVLETLFFADEIRDPDRTLDNLPGEMAFSDAELGMARQLIETMDEPWNPDHYRDTFTDRLNDLIEAKRQGNEVQQAKDVPETTNVIDLFEALRQSVDSARGANRGTRNARSARERGANPHQTKVTPKKAARRMSAKSTPGKKAAAKKAPTRKAAREVDRRTRKAS